MITKKKPRQKIMVSLPPQSMFSRKSQKASSFAFAQIRLNFLARRKLATGVMPPLFGTRHFRFSEILFGRFG